MSYRYEDFRNEAFTERGVKNLLTMAEVARRLTKLAGCFTAVKIMPIGDTFTSLALIDFLVEVGVLAVICDKGRGQDAVLKWVERE